MNGDAEAEVLVAAFFDGPGLLGVRFTFRDGGASRLAAYATTRRPDIGPTVPLGAIAGIVGVGLAVAFVAVPLISGPSRRYADSGYASGPVPTQVNPATVPDNVPDSTDVDGGTAWAATLPVLGDDLAPKREDLRPWMVRTLLDVPRELNRRDHSTSWLVPRCSADDRTANARGETLAAILTDAGCGRETAVILDLPGPLSVSAAAGMARRFDPVFTSDNLPHPAGVVPSARALAAAVYWRPRYLAVRAGRSPDAPPVFVLEGSRLSAYHNEVSRFDNRSRARLPDAVGFKALGVTRILYVREHRGQVTDADDLNQSFLALAVADLEVRYLALETLDTMVPTSAEQDPLASTRHQRWFWQQYGWGRPEGTLLPEADDADAAYRTTPRPTQFDPNATPTPMDGGERDRDAVLTALAPAVVVANRPSSGSGTTYSSGTTTSSGTTWFPTATHLSSSSSSWGGGSWPRSSGFGFSSS